MKENINLQVVLTLVFVAQNERDSRDRSVPEEGQQQPADGNISHIHHMGNRPFLNLLLNITLFTFRTPKTSFFCSHKL